jgi:hypothetical protein
MTETSCTINIDPTHIAWRCGVEDPRRVVSDLEGALADAKARRGKILVDLAKVAAAIDKGDQRARFVQGALNKQEAAAGRLVLSIDKQLEWARKHVRMAQAQADAVAEKARQAAERGETGRLVQLEISAPDGRVLRQWHKSVDAAREALQSGYEVTGEVIGSGVVSPIGPGARSFMKALLDLQGDVLMEWLVERGVVGSDKQAVVVLPGNGRDMQ